MLTPDTLPRDRFHEDWPIGFEPARADREGGEQMAEKKISPKAPEQVETTAARTAAARVSKKKLHAKKLHAKKLHAKKMHG